MRRRLAAMTWREDEWYVAQCLEVDVASQGTTEAEALDNLREALELYFESPCPVPETHRHVIEVDYEAVALS